MQSDSASLSIGAFTAQGPRTYQEDRYLLVPDWSVAGTSTGLFAVFDGHSGDAISTLASEHLPRCLQQELEKASDGKKHWCTLKGCQQVIQKAFLRADRLLTAEADAHKCGSTCILALVCGEANTLKKRVFLANLGDSRGLVVRGGGSAKAVGQILGETVDHKPDVEQEEKRIKQAGGFVGKAVPAFGIPSRVDAILGVSRSFGDKYLKDNEKLPPEKQKVCPVPDIYEFECQRGDAIVIASDGLWDVLPSQEVASQVVPRQCGSSGTAADPQALAESLVKLALARGSGDNVTCVIVRLSPSANSKANCKSPSKFQLPDLPTDGAQPSCPLSIPVTLLQEQPLILSSRSREVELQDFFEAIKE